MLVDTTDHPIMNDDVKYISMQAQEIPIIVPNRRNTTSYGRNVNHTHSDRTDWAETLHSHTDDEIVTNTDGKPETEQKTTTRKRIADTS